MNKIAFGFLTTVITLSLFSTSVYADSKNGDNDGPKGRPFMGNFLRGFGKKDLDDSTRSFRFRAGTNSASLRSCQVKERNLGKRMEQLIRLSTNIENVFGKIATRIETNYTTNLVPKGIIVSNYSALTADIVTKKAAVGSDLTKTKNDVAGFSCATGNIASATSLFRADMQTVKKALKDLRTSVRNLILAINHAKGAADKSEDSSENKPTPTVTPTATPKPTPTSTLTPTPTSTPTPTPIQAI